jgi:hypothetical protein
MFEMKNNSEQHNICSKCKLFCVGIFDSIIVDSCTIKHHTLDMSFESDYAINHLLLGTQATDFCRSFHEIIPTDIEKSLDALDNLGAPCNHSDKDAYCTSLAILHFLEVWSKFPKIRMIMHHEEMVA